MICGAKISKDFGCLNRSLRRLFTLALPGKSTKKTDPGDIEVILTRQPGVDQAVALRWPVESESAHGIVAFVAGSLEDPTSLYDAVRQELPVYMIPNKIQVISSTPLNSKGKIDRNALRSAAVGRMTSCVVF